MTRRQLSPPAPEPLEAYAADFDDLFNRLSQRRSFREYLQGLLLPRDRNKTLTALAGAEPVLGAQHAAVQSLQFFLSESTWDIAKVNQRRLELMFTDPATATHEQGVLILDDSGDRKEGNQTAHVARQYLGSVGKVDNGIVAVSSLWADERMYYPLHGEPYTPAQRLAGGRRDPDFRTKPQIAVALVDAALEAGVLFRAVVADCFYGESATFEGTLWEAGLPYVVALKASKGAWAGAEEAHTPKEAALGLAWHGPEEPGDWTPAVRRFRDGHEERWWAAELTFGGYGPDQSVRLVAATTDPATLPAGSSWYLATNLPRPGAPLEADLSLEPAGLAEIVRLYGLRNWVEQSYKQLKQELGWADFMVRSDRAIRRHWQLVWCAFCFCWCAWFGQSAKRGEEPEPGGGITAIEEWETKPTNGAASDAAACEDSGTAAAGERGEKRAAEVRSKGGLVAGGAATGACLARTVDDVVALLARVVRLAPA